MEGALFSTIILNILNQELPEGNLQFIHKKFIEFGNIFHIQGGKVVLGMSKNRMNLLLTLHESPQRMQSYHEQVSSRDLLLRVYTLFYKALVNQKL